MLPQPRPRRPSGRRSMRPLAIDVPRFAKLSGVSGRRWNGDDPAHLAATPRTSCNRARRRCRISGESRPILWQTSSRLQWWRPGEDRAAGQIGKQVIAPIFSRPARTRWHERATGDRPAPRLVFVGMDWLDKPRGLGTVSSAPSDTWSLANVPAVISSGSAHVDLFPGAATDVVDEELLSSGRVVRIECDAEGIAESGRKDLLAVRGWPCTGSWFCRFLRRCCLRFCFAFFFLWFLCCFFFPFLFFLRFFSDLSPAVPSWSWLGVPPVEEHLAVPGP